MATCSSILAWKIPWTEEPDGYSPLGQKVRHGLAPEQEHFRAMFHYAVCSVMSDSLRPHEPVARQAPLSLGFSRQEYWSGLSFPPPGDLTDPGIEPMSPASPALEGRFFTIGPSRKSF